MISFVKVTFFSFIALLVASFVVQTHLTYGFHCGDETTSHAPGGEQWDCPEAGAGRGPGEDGAGRGPGEDGAGRGGYIDDSDRPETIKLFDPINKSIEDIFRAILDIIMVFAVPIILFFIVFAGFQYVTAQGNASKIEQAHKALLYALVGGLLILGANVLLAVIVNTIELFA